jgi:hypothetical protein
MIDDKYETTSKAIGRIVILRFPQTNQETVI